MAKGTKTGGGSRKGKPNKITADIRAGMAEVLQGNFAKFAKKLNEIKDPKHYCEVFLKACEYNIPKLAKVEQTVRHAVTAEQMTDAELKAVAGIDIPDTGETDSPGPGERTH